MVLATGRIFKWSRCQEKTQQMKRAETFRTIFSGNYTADSTGKSTFWQVFKMFRRLANNGSGLYAVKTITFGLDAKVPTISIAILMGH